MTKSGAIIKAKREAMKITQIELSEQLGYTNQYISNIERGVCLIPATMVRPICMILKLRKTSLVDIILEDIRDTFYSEA